MDTNKQILPVPADKVELITPGLLTPRVKLINTYPHCQWEVGMVLIEDSATGEMYSTEYGYIQSKYVVKFADANKWPDIFRKLNWWEDRGIKEMPLYVKVVDKPKLTSKFASKVFKVREWIFGSSLPMCPIEGYWHDADEIIPATKEEYEAYIKSKQCP